MVPGPMWSPVEPCQTHWADLGAIYGPGLHGQTGGRAAGGRAGGWGDLKAPITTNSAYFWGFFGPICARMGPYGPGPGPGRAGKVQEKIFSSNIFLQKK